MQLTSHLLQPRRLSTLDALLELQAQGHLCFSNEQFAALTGREPGSLALKAALTRLSRDGKVFSLRKRPSVWLIAQLGALAGRAPDYRLWLHEFLLQIDPQYYLGFAWAARHWGCTQLDSSLFQVCCSTVNSPIALNSFEISFVVKKKGAQTPCVQLSDAQGSLRVSSPEATLLDLIRHPETIGGTEALILAFCELLPQFTESGWTCALDALDNAACAQRAGFLTDCMGLAWAADCTERWLALRRHTSIAFDSKTEKETPYTNKRFKIRYGEFERDIVGR